MRFAIFTHVIHHRIQGRYHAYSPYVREMNLWFKYPEEVEVVAALEKRRRMGEKETRGMEARYLHENLTFTAIPAFNLLGVKNIVIALFKIPVIFFRIMRAMRRADHLHLRCPGNIGLLAAIAQIFFPKKPKSVKYAGNWDPDARQPLSYRLQKWILSNTFLSRKLKVLVYGDWPGRTKNVIPFFTASFSEKDRELVQKDFSPPYKFVYTGNLVEGKGVFEAINLIWALKKKGVEVELEIYGDGALKDSLRDYIQKKELQKFVRLKGRKSLEELKQAYREAHFVVLLSKSEGWPKTLAEGMWFGCVPVATNVSCVPWILDYARRGILDGSGFKVQSLSFKAQGSGTYDKNLKSKLEKGGRGLTGVESGKWKVDRQHGLEDTVRKIVEHINNPEEMKRMSMAAQKWSQEYTLERFEKSIKQILIEEKPNKVYPNPNSSKTKTDNPQPTPDNHKQQTINHKHLRVLQLIDTLNPGGAERMAVNLANSLVGEIEASYLCCTRKEGTLKQELQKEVGYLFLNKKHSLDQNAFWKLRTFIKKHQIDLVHAHGTSWFWGVLLKLSGLKLKLVWHDHYGESERIEQRDINFLKPLSKYFDGIISVNEDLKAWAQRELKSTEVIQLNNFIMPSDGINSGQLLKSSSADFKIICVANLRPQKDHLNLLAAFEKLDIKKISLHLIGADPGTIYSKKVREKIANSEKKIFYYGGLPEVSGLLQQADLGVLSSRSEGLPLALLEYALAGLPVVCTEVGNCKKVTGSSALLVPPGDPDALAVAITQYFSNSNMRTRDALSLQTRIRKAYSKKEVLPLFLEFYTNLRLR
ncbi:glycosyltransferase family 4 protein [Salegentibacter sediminis]|uniref:glycosyltransferase family 4 protein n=1 Tax=Salegentibacter sediminis TaxID=1930251 RepID=UPI0009C13EF8|nr:glycosyltransferase [Salegentibacter sediminis]